MYPTSESIVAFSEAGRCKCGQPTESYYIAKCDDCESQARKADDAAQWAIRLREKAAASRVPESTWPAFVTRDAMLSDMLRLCAVSRNEVLRACGGSDLIVGVSRLALPLSVVIFGDAARGKTTLACTVLGLKLRRDMHREAVKHNHYESKRRLALGMAALPSLGDLPPGFEGERTGGLFVRCDELWTSGDQKSFVQVNHEMVSRAKTVSLLVLDELIAPPNPTALGALRGVLWERRERGLPTVVTTGMRPEQLRAALPDGGFEHRLGFVGDASAVHIDLGTTAQILRAVAS